jgi:hypothetical protein
MYTLPGFADNSIRNSLAAGCPRGATKEQKNGEDVRFINKFLGATEEENNIKVLRSTN